MADWVWPAVWTTLVLVVVVARYRYDVVQDAKMRAEVENARRIESALREVRAIEDHATMQLLRRLLATQLSPDQQAAFRDYRVAIGKAHDVMDALEEEVPR